MQMLCRCRAATSAIVLAGQTLLTVLMCAAVFHSEALAQEAAAGNAVAAKVPAAPTTPRKLDDVIASANSFRISDVMLFDGDRVIEATVVVRGGWISRVCGNGSPQCASEDVPTIGRSRLDGRCDLCRGRSYRKGGSL
jgi:hypothetical protein